jgi:hypothetical protein
MGARPLTWVGEKADTAHGMQGSVVEAPWGSIPVSACALWAPALPIAFTEQQLAASRRARATLG